MAVGFIERKLLSRSQGSSQTKQPQPSLLAVNLDLIEQCLSFLDAANLHRAAQVCRQWRACTSNSNSRFWHIVLERLQSPEALPAAPPFSQWNTGQFDATWKHLQARQSRSSRHDDAIASLMGLPAQQPADSGQVAAAHAEPSSSDQSAVSDEVFQPALIPWDGPLHRIVHARGSLLCLTQSPGGPSGMPACTGPCTPKGLALDLLFLKAQSRFIVHQPMRIPVVDSTANSAQVYPFILMPSVRAPLTAQHFFSLVGLHPDVVQASSVADLVGSKAVRKRYEQQLKEMRSSMVWRLVMDKQAQSQGAPASRSTDKSAPFWRFISCLERLVQYAAGNRVMYIVCRSSKDPQLAVSPVPVFWVAQSRQGSILGLLSSAKWD